MRRSVFSVFLFIVLGISATTTIAPAYARAAPLSAPASYTCTVRSQGLGPGLIFCNGIFLSGTIGVPPKPFFTAVVAPGQAVQVSGTVTLPPRTPRFCGAIASLRIVSDTATRQDRIIGSGTITWTNATNAPQTVRLFWQSGEPCGSYDVRGTVQVS